MTRRIEKLPTPQGIGVGQTATLNLPLGPTYHRFDLRLKAAASGGTAADVTAANWGNYIDDIRLIVDGDVRIEITAEQLVKRAQFFGYSLQTGVLPLFLSMPWARTMGGEDQTAYGTNGGMSSFTLEVDFKDNVVIGSFRVYAEQSEPMPFGPHLRIQRFAKSFSVIGLEEISDLPRGAYALLGIDVTNTSVGDIEILANNNRVHVSDKAIRESNHKIAKRVKQTGMTHLDFMPQDRVNEAMPMALQDFRVKLDFTTAPGAYDIYMTSIHGNL